MPILMFAAMWGVIFGMFSQPTERDAEDVEGETYCSSACCARLRNSPRNRLTLQAQALHSGTTLERAV